VLGNSRVICKKSGANGQKHTPFLRDVVAILQKMHNLRYTSPFQRLTSDYRLFTR
jgi:hypothetical protein